MSPWRHEQHGAQGSFDVSFLGCELDMSLRLYVRLDKGGIRGTQGDFGECMDPRSQSWRPCETYVIYIEVSTP